MPCALGQACRHIPHHVTVCMQESAGDSAVRDMHGAGASSSPMRDERIDDLINLIQELDDAADDFEKSVQRLASGTGSIQAHDTGTPSSQIHNTCRPSMPCYSRACLRIRARPSMQHLFQQ